MVNWILQQTDIQPESYAAPNVNPNNNHALSTTNAE